MEEQKKPSAIVAKAIRSNGMGEYDDCFIYSMQQQKELNPQRGHTTRCGTHGGKIWFLLPGCYFQIIASFSNSRKGGWRYGVLTINEDLVQSLESIDEMPDWLNQIAPTSPLKTLTPEPHW